MLEDKINKQDHSNLHKYLSILGVLTAVIITAFVLFYPPMPGVADQGDFQRVMTVTGLKEISVSQTDFETHWFKFVTPNYEMISLKFYRFFNIIPTTSMIYPITLARVLCRLVGMKYFSTKVLAFIYVLLYILCLYLCLRNLNFKKISTNIFFIILSTLILMDGNYLIWFNSLYGEPMMIIGLLSFSASILYLANNIKFINSRTILFVFISAILFLGAKTQCFSALPLIILFIIRISSLQNTSKKKIRIKPLCVGILFIFFYIGGIYIQTNSTCGIDTRYNSVFYGILKSSTTPKKDLAALGLPEDMSVEAGKHAYLPKDEYVKYAPGSDLTKNEFNKKISNLKLLKFYLIQPARLIKGMEYTSSQCFDTRGFLGKFERSDVKPYTYAFNRFTFWSDFRSSKLPKNLIFLIFFYFLVILISIIEYIRKKEDVSSRLRIELLWVIMLIGLLQFPMPYIGNGEADTAKQLFLFNYTFDITTLAVCTWSFDKLSDSIFYISRFIKNYI